MPKRFKHSLSHYRLLTCDMGELVPIGMAEVIPGDTFDHRTSLLVRVSPLLTPVMHPVEIRVHHWFVPYRLLWLEWEEFITSATNIVGFPTITSGASHGAGTLADYLGVPPVTGLSLSALPFRAYTLIVNEWYRDNDIDAIRGFTDAGGTDSTTDVTLFRVRWGKDYFTSCRPWPQIGTAVTVPLNLPGTDIQVRTEADATTRIVQGQVTDNDLSLSGGALGATSDLRWVDPALNVLPARS